MKKLTVRQDRFLDRKLGIKPGSRLDDILDKKLIKKKKVKST